MTGDLLSEALGLMRITGSIVLAECYTPPWAVAIPDEAQLQRMLGIAPELRVGAFHAVHRGGCLVSGADGSAIEVGEGEVVVAFGGLPHSIGQDQPRDVMSFESRLRDGANTSGSRRLDTGPTALICGVFMLRDTALNPLAASLPPFVHLSRAALETAGLSLAIPALLGQEIVRPQPGGAFAMQRLLELLCVDVVRTHLLASAEHDPGWFRALRDSALSKALHQFHAHPGEPWSVARLAAAANLSPSHFAARFAASMGESCMAYVTRWRLRRACSLLSATDDSVETIAERVGYTNLPAFTRVFRRYLNATPTVWRTQQRERPRTREAADALERL